MEAAPEDARRALVLHDRSLIVDLITLTPQPRGIRRPGGDDLAEAMTILAGWGPTSRWSIWITTTAPRCSATWGRRTRSPEHDPVAGTDPPRRPRTKLSAFDLGVDDILTMPFSPEELLARSIVVTRRTAPAGRSCPPSSSARSRSTSSAVRSAPALRRRPSGIEQSLLYLLASRAGRVTTREDVRCGLGPRFRRREQHRRPPCPQPPRQAPERLSPPALHRHRAGSRVPVHPHVLEPRMDGRRGARPAGLITSGPTRLGVTSFDRRCAAGRVMTDRNDEPGPVAHSRDRPAAHTSPTSGRSSPQDGTDARTGPSCTHVGSV